MVPLDDFGIIHPFQFPKLFLRKHLFQIGYSLSGEIGISIPSSEDLCKPVLRLSPNDKVVETRKGDMRNKVYEDCKSELIAHKGKCQYCGENFLGDVCKDVKMAFDTLNDLFQVIQEAEQDEKYEEHNKLCNMQNQEDDAKTLLVINCF